MTAAPLLRPARPVHDDGVAFARHLDIAADGFFRMMLGRRFDDVIATAFPEPGHDLSHEHVTFAERDGRIVGTASGHSAQEHATSSEQPLIQAAGRLLAVRMAIFSAIARPVLRFLDHLPEGDFYLLAVAVDDDQRGLGTGSLLIDHMEERASAQGCERLVLDVAAGNDAARRLYERRGMTVEAESPHPPFMASARALRMVKTI